MQHSTACIETRGQLLTSLLTFCCHFAKNTRAVDSHMHKKYLTCSKNNAHILRSLVLVKNFEGASPPSHHLYLRSVIMYGLTGNVPSQSPFSEPMYGWLSKSSNHP